MALLLLLLLLLVGVVPSSQCLEPLVSGGLTAFASLFEARYATSTTTDAAAGAAAAAAAAVRRTLL